MIVNQGLCTLLKANLTYHEMLSLPPWTVLVEGHLHQDLVREAQHLTEGFSVEALRLVKVGQRCLGGMI